MICRDLQFGGFWKSEGFGEFAIEGIFTNGGNLENLQWLGF